MDLHKLHSEGDINISPLRAEHLKTLDKESRYWLQKDEQLFFHQALSTPCLNVLKAAQASSIYDLQGHELLDFHGNNVHQLGFGHPKVIEAISRQMQELSFCTRRYTNKTTIQLAEKLISLTPKGLDKLLFAPGGSLAMGMAIKLARVVTGRHKTISLWDSFHGASLDAISIGGEAAFRSDIGPLLPGNEHVPPPDPPNCPFRCGSSCQLYCADYIDYVLEKEGDVAAVIAETIRSTPYIPPIDYWKKVRASCDRHGALLILDEIPHCLGRTGKMFTYEHYDIVPDMLVIGKGLGGGIFPLAALIARAEFDVMQHQSLGHYTHEKNPVACAAALATLQLIEEESLLQKVVEKGAYFEKALHQLKARFPIISDVRGLGLFWGVELRKADGRKATQEAEIIMYQALQQGLNFKVSMGNVLSLSPPLVISIQEIDRALEILQNCFLATHTTTI